MIVTMKLDFTKNLQWCLIPNNIAYWKWRFNYLIQIPLSEIIPQKQNCALLSQNVYLCGYGERELVKFCDNFLVGKGNIEIRAKTSVL